MNEPVDAVITWVDGLEPEYAQKLNFHLSQQNIEKDDAGVHPTRFNQCGEISFCVNSIFKYAPWIRNIYIVTDNQVPTLNHTFPLLKDKIKIIDHKEIFKGYEQFLPTFNSLSIETMLWRIEGLSENFIYFNDDCFLIRPVAKEDFFQDGKLILRGYFRTQSKKKLLNCLPQTIKKILKSDQRSIPQHRKVQENSAYRAGFKRAFFQLPHTPFGNFKKIYENYFSKNEDLLINNIKYPFRNEKQLWSISLTQHLMIKNFDVLFDNSLKAVTINGSFHSEEKIKKLIKKTEDNPNVAFVCLQSLDITPTETRDYLLKWISKWI